MGSEVLADNIGDWSKMGIAILLYYPQGNSPSFRIPIGVSIDWVESIISVLYKTLNICFLFNYGLSGNREYDQQRGLFRLLFGRVDGFQIAPKIMSLPPGFHGKQALRDKEDSFALNHPACILLPISGL